LKSPKRRLVLSESAKRGKGNRIFWGLVLIAVGVLILCRNLGLVEEEVVRFWPVILILLGIKKLIK